MGNVLDEFDFLLDKSTFIDDTNNLIDKANKFIDNANKNPDCTFQGIKLIDIAACISIDKSDIYNETHVIFTINLNKLKDINNEPIREFKVPDFVEELQSVGDKEGNGKNLLVDFFNHVKTYDIDFKYIAPSPFIGELEIIDQEFVDEFVLDEKHLTFEDYNYMVIGNTLARIAYDRNRDYYIGSEISCYTEYDVKKCKEKKRDI